MRCVVGVYAVHAHDECVVGLRVHGACWRGCMLVVRLEGCVHMVREVGERAHVRARLISLSFGGIEIDRLIAYEGAPAASAERGSCGRPRWE